ncbi:MAG TPA: S8 family serine peptidase, partial [Geobacteraceae bacterium]
MGSTNKVAFAPDRIIVKFRDSVTEAADMIHGSGVRFAYFTATHGDQLDELNTRFGVTGIAPLFQPLLRVEKDDGRLKTRVGRKELFTERFKHARVQHAKRSARASTQGALPDLSHIYIVTVAAGTDITAACRSYATNPNVEYAVPSYAMEPQSLPNDPYFSSRGSWGNSYDDMWGLKKIQADLAWGTAKGEGVVVAVVDTGLDYNHADIAANVWTNTAEAAGVSGVDDDGNGYLDDTRGRHFDYAYPGVAVSDNDVMDSNGHGTFV